MHSLRLAEPPRLLRSVAILAAALCAIAVLAGVPWISRHRAPEPQAAPKPVQPEKERRIRVVRIPRPAPVRTEVPKPVATPPPKEPPRAVPKPQPPPPARPLPQQMQAAARPPDASPRPAQHPIAPAAPELTAVKGVPLHILVPETPALLASHLRNSGGCLVVSSLSGDEDEGVLSVFTVQGSSLVEVHGQPPCAGVPRRLSDTVNAALGDLVGRVRGELPGHRNLILQAYLSPTLPDRAQSTLAARFGPIAQQEMAEKAAQSGYELKCYAEPTGAIHCE
jgi:hypothetical protein